MPLPRPAMRTWTELGRAGVEHAGETAGPATDTKCSACPTKIADIFRTTPGSGSPIRSAEPASIDLGLVGKQVHWSLTGSGFRSIHLQLDDVVATARMYQDTAAERAVAIGLLPDGRADTVQERCALPQPPLQCHSNPPKPRASTSNAMAS